MQRTLARLIDGNKRRAGAAQSVKTKVGSVVPKIRDLTNKSTGERDMADKTRYPPPIKASRLGPCQMKSPYIYRHPSGCAEHR